MKALTEFCNKHGINIKYNAAKESLIFEKGPKVIKYKFFRTNESSMTKNYKTKRIIKLLSREFEIKDDDGSKSS